MIIETCTHPRCFNPKPCRVHQAVYRDTKTQQEKWFYGSAQWKRARAAHRQKEPLCRMCLQEDNITRVGDMVDHIISIRNGGNPLDDANLQTLCNPHHDAKRQREQRNAR